MIRQAQRQSTDMRFIATAHLANTMRLIEKTCVELEAEIANELAENPALQLDEQRHCPECRKPVDSFPCPYCEMRRRTLEQDGPIVYLSPRPAASSNSGNHDSDDTPFASRLRQPETLAEHVLRQLILDLDADDRKIAEHILDRLDERGLLPDRIAEIAVYLHVLPTRIERILTLIQRSDPVGLAARDVHESLTIQVAALKAENRAHPLAGVIIREHWELLGKRDYRALARRLRAPLSDIEDAAAFIRKNLTPYPARAYWGHDDRAGERYFNPDARITRNPYKPQGPLVIEIYTPTCGRLRVDPYVRAAIQKIEDESDRAEWANYVERAALFAKCLRQRNNAMRRVLSVIVERQRGFILNGNSELVPMTRAELAETVEVHESTVSRAVSHKTVALPSGQMIPLSRFFDRSLPVREAVRNIVELETKPLTDEQISSALQDYGFTVARRTVAKYRSMLGILPASIRARHLAGAPTGHAI